MPKNSEAIRLAEASDWKGLQRLIEKAPEFACESGDYGMLPVHWACTENHVPLSLLHRLLAAYPEGASTKNDAELLPLHIAIRARVHAAWLEALLDVYPEAVHVPMSNGVTAWDLAEQVGLGIDAMKVLSKYLQGDGQVEDECPEDDGYALVQKDSKTADQQCYASSLDHEWPSLRHTTGGGVRGSIINLVASQDNSLDLPGSPIASVSSVSDTSISSPHDHLVSPSSTSTSSNAHSASSVNSAPMPLTQPIASSKQLRGPFHRKHSLDYHAQAAAMAAATVWQDPRRNRTVLGLSNGAPGSGGLLRSQLGGRHQSLPVIPSFETFQFPIQQIYRDQNDLSSSDEEDENHPNAFSGSSQRQHHRRGLNHSGVRSFESPPEWKRDDECSICRASFGMFKHRHHCRNCGKSICSQHSADKKITMASKGFTTPQRVCVTCFAMITHQRTQEQQQFQPPSQQHVDPILDAFQSNPTTLQHAPPPPNSSASARSSQHNGSTSSPLSPSSVSLSMSQVQTNADFTNSGRNKDKVENYMLQAQVGELRQVVGSQQKQMDQLVQSNMQMQQQLLEQEELKAETMLLITQLMTRVSALELRNQQNEAEDEENQAPQSYE